LLRSTYEEILSLRGIDREMINAEPMINLIKYERKLGQRFGRFSARKHTGTGKTCNTTHRLESKPYVWCRATYMYV